MNVKIAYVSNLISKKTLAEVYGFGPGTPGQQAQKYNRLLSQGLAAFCDVKNVSFPACTHRTTKNLSLTLPAEQSDGIDFHYLKAINFPLIKNLSAVTQAKKAIRKLLTDSGLEGNAVVCDLCCASASHGALRSAKKHGIPTIGIITDLPEYLSGGAGSKAFKKLFENNLSLCDGFVLMTEQMSTRPGISGKPYVVIEGMVQAELASEELKVKSEKRKVKSEKLKVKSEERKVKSEKPETESYEAGDAFSAENKNSPKVVIYAGGLESAYNVDGLIDAFLNIGIGELWLYGNGSLAENIGKIAENNPSVKYFGVAPNDVVVEAEKHATLLVNPRLPSGEFTKYSFPSKNMEYMASGTPLLCYMLPGMPEEYGKFILPIGENLEKSLRDALEKSPEELSEIGLSAQKFVIENKDNKTQASRLI